MLKNRAVGASFPASFFKNPCSIHVCTWSKMDFFEEKPKSVSISAYEGRRRCLRKKVLRRASKSFFIGAYSIVNNRFLCQANISIGCCIHFITFAVANLEHCGIVFLYSTPKENNNRNRGANTRTNNHS